jgi:prepilin-type N-terminal cleavage/methylation domain-containing protein
MPDRTFSAEGWGNIVLFNNEKGFSLIEALVAMALLGIVTVGFLSALTTSSRASISIDNLDTGRAIAQSQMEDVKEQAFQSTGIYTVNSDLMAEYPGYTVSIPQASAAASRDAFIQKIVVVVSRADKEVARLEDFKVKR